MGISGKIFSRNLFLSLGIAVVTFLVGSFVYLTYFYVTYEIPSLNRFAGTQATIVLFSDGSEMGRFANENRVEVSIQQVPQFLQKAVFAAEDERFLSQPAFSAPAIARAFWNNVRGNQLQGGSTITQQYAKIAYLSQERSYSRKIKELIIAIKLEQRFSKEEILEKYLNTIYFGRGCYGIETAANQFFGKSVQNLSPEESIAIASMIRAPGSYNPRDSERLSYLQTRFNHVKEKYDS